MKSWNEVSLLSFWPPSFALRANCEQKDKGREIRDYESDRRNLPHNCITQKVFGGIPLAPIYKLVFCLKINEQDSLINRNISRKVLSQLSFWHSLAAFADHLPDLLFRCFCHCDWVWFFCHYSRCGNCHYDRCWFACHHKHTNKLFYASIGLFGRIGCKTF